MKGYSIANYEEIGLKGFTNESIAYGIVHMQP